MTNLDSSTKSVGKLLSEDFFFNVPEYQRPFMWSKENLGDLVDDLLNAPKDSDYFLGTVVLHDQGNKRFDIVDGQQRITALCLLTACIRDLIDNSIDPKFRRDLHKMLVEEGSQLHGIPQINRLSVRQQSTFNGYVAVDGGTVELGNSAAGGSVDERYQIAISTFRDRLSHLAAADLKSFASFVSQHCVLIVLSTVGFDNAFRLFTIVNDRGRQLRRVDLIKAANISPDVIADDTTRKNYAGVWTQLESDLGDHSFEELFFLLRLIYVQEKPQADLHKEFERRVWGRQGMPQRGAEFVDAVVSYAGLYDSIFITRDYLDGTEFETRFRTLIAAMDLEFRASEWRACVLKFAKAFGRDLFWEYLLKIERVYLAQWVKAMRKDERYGEYTDLLKAMRSGTSAAEVVEGVHVSDEDIKAGARVDNFYSVGYAKYMLIRAEIVSGELNDARDFRPRSIEHVFPQNPSENSEWISWMTPDEAKRHVNSAGNLVLLSRAKNSSAQNKELALKQDTYLKNRVTDYPRSVEVLAYSVWDADVIVARTDQFAELVVAPL